MAGGKPAWLASQLGHTLDVFLKDYATWISSDSDDAELAAILAGRNKSGPKMVQSGDKKA